MSKKAQGLSMSTIVITALALIVLVVLIAMFTGRMSQSNQGLDDTQNCHNLNGYCVEKPSDCDNGLILGAMGCPFEDSFPVDNGGYCCQVQRTVVPDEDYE